MDTTVSRNFSILKVLSIFAVVASHWFKELDLWILATIALFLFGFSSAFFTGRIYGSEVDIRAFWKNKLRRLGVRYWLILSVLAIFLVAQGRDVLHWHSIVHFVGLSGVLNLFGPSASELGRGLWFFTLLLLFYAAYPLLAPRLAASARATFVMVACTAGLLALDQLIQVGFSLWSTMLGFLVGIYVGVNRLRLNATVLNAAIITIPIVLAVANVALHIKDFNMLLLYAFALALSLRLTLPGLVLGGLSFLVAIEACLLEIYLIHSYLFSRPTGYGVIDFLISIIVIVGAAIFLNRAGNRLVACLFKRTTLKVVVVPTDPEYDEQSQQMV
jgi:hypothetical protein